MRHPIRGVSRVRVSSLHIYPVKSLAQVDCESLHLDPWGPEGDRRWMVVDEGGTFITQRTNPDMARIKAVLSSDGVRLKEGDFSITVKIPVKRERRVRVWKSEVLACDAGEEAASWLTERLKRSCRLVYMDQPAEARKQHYQGVNYVNSFADGFPVLLCTEASLGDLNRRLADAVPMERFRPNIVIAGSRAWEEDGWRRLMIGETILRIMKPSSRCVTITVDQQEGKIPVVGQPLKTLGQFRRQEDGIIFGQNVLIERPGRIAVGDEVTLLS
nr:MOSC N-terminal beta barrel domain-containing protein [Saccharibacter sp. 17.LH.SD]